jgi:hypothetical protein
MAQPMIHGLYIRLVETLAQFIENAKNFSWHLGAKKTWVLRSVILI